MSVSLYAEVSCVVLAFYFVIHISFIPLVLEGTSGQLLKQFSSWHFSLYTQATLLAVCNSLVSSTKSQPLTNNQQFLSLMRRQIYSKCFLGLMLWIEWLCEIIVFMNVCEEHTSMSSIVLYQYIHSLNANGYFK